MTMTVPTPPAPPGSEAALCPICQTTLAPGEATLTLSGLFKDGNSFSATDVVTVK